MKGWFDAFRYDGGPTLYNFNNRTAVTGDVTIITFLAIFSTLYVAFLIIFPGIRKEKFTTFCAVTLSLFVGATILISIFGSSWHISNAPILCQYRAFSTEKMAANLGVYIGLQHVNITLQAVTISNSSIDVDFNEQFLLLDYNQRRDSYKEALARGLPFPILTAAEYLMTGQEGLAWGAQYRAAGYFAIIMLWSCFSVWVLMNLMLMVVPRYGALLMTVCGLLMLATVCGYLGMLPENPLEIYVPSTFLKFRFGWCYWLVLIAGSLCLLAGVIITTIEIVNPHSFSTILEVDYDTPYDRHVIIEDSRGKRFQKKRTSTGKLEEPDSIGNRILRRLSSKTKDDKAEPTCSTNKVEKHTFEIGEKNSTWKYPYKTQEERPSRNFRRSSNSQDSITSISRDVPQNHDSNMFRYPEKATPVSMW